MTTKDRGAILITGASSGIGATCAGRLTSLGFRVFAGVRREQDYKELEQKQNPLLIPVILDVTEKDSIAAAAERVTQAVGEEGLIGLVNNAGIGVAGPLEFLPVELFCQQIEVNVTGHLAVTQAFLPLIRKGHGRIVFISSVNGRSNFPLLGPYCASKHALESLADALRMELYPWKIAIALIEPGSVATPIWQKSLESGEEMERHLPAQAHEFYGRAINRMKKIARNSGKNGMNPQEVAEAVIHALTSPRPKTRYLVGMEVKLQMALQMLPTALRDRIVTNALYGKSRATK
ncbi:MAG TPA: SDR family oxidoreductase [Chloroflexia bacterium]|nr:SDR family oxidoreductase [Chloroflexia bacterium]